VFGRASEKVQVQPAGGTETISHAESSGRKTIGQINHGKPIGKPIGKP